MAEQDGKIMQAPAFSFSAHYELVVPGYTNAALSVPAIQQGGECQAKDLLAVGEVSADGKFTEREHLEHLQAKGAIDTHQPLLVLGARNNLVNLRCPVVLDGQVHAVAGEDPLRSLRPYYGLGLKNQRFVCETVHADGFNEFAPSDELSSNIPSPHGGGLGCNAVELSRHSGMDRRNPDCMEAPIPHRPRSLGSGDPCRNDGDNLNSTTLPHGGGLGWGRSNSDFFCAGIPVLWDGIDGDELLDLILCEAADHSHVYDLPRGNNPKATDATRNAWASLHAVFIEKLYSDLPDAVNALRRVINDCNPPLQRCDDYFHAVYGVREDGALVCLFAQGRLEELGQIMKQRGWRRAVVLENSGSIMPSFLPKGVEGDSIPLVRAPNFRARGRAVVAMELEKAGFASQPI